MGKQIKERRINAVKPLSNLLFSILFAVLAFVSIFPLLLVFMISISSEDSIRQLGYSLIPMEFSAKAYEFLWNERDTIINAFFVSALVTVAGTVIGVAITTMLGYSISRPDFKLKGILTWVVFIPMIFNGGMAASYVVNSSLFQLGNTLYILILPLLISSFNVIICKTFFRTTIPDSIIESAKIDGASQMTIFTKIIVPISKPVYATLGLFLSFGYWNDWFLASLYLSDTKLFSLQAMLNNMIKQLDYIANNPAVGVSLQEYKRNMPSESVRMAIAVIIVIPIACAYPFFQKYFIKGLTVGSVKG